MHASPPYPLLRLPRSVTTRTARTARSRSTRSRSARSTALIVAVVALLSVACGGNATPTAGGATPVAPAVGTAAPVGAKPRVAAKVANPVPGTAGELAAVKPTVTRIDVFSAEGDAATKQPTLDNPWLYDPKQPDSKIALAFMVKQDKGDWLEVYTGKPPTGSTGWVRSRDVDLQPARYRLEITLSAYNLKAFDGDKLMLDAPIAIGKGPRPTLPGLHFLNVLLKVPPDTPFYGTYAFGLSAYSDDEAVLKDFPGGQLGIHGTNDPGSIGKAASNGCIRLTNDNITKLANALPLGTPVVVTA